MFSPPLTMARPLPNELMLDILKEVQKSINISSSTETHQKTTTHLLSTNFEEQQ